MCGIAGILFGRAGLEHPRRVLTGLVRNLHHRGPDDQGTWVSKDQRAGLGATRLAILDLSPAGHQPMTSRDGRFTIVFNGEIFNYAALRAQITDNGEPLISRSDTEVVLELYAREGAACLEKLRGMFAFAIWDAQEKTCFLARDPLGIKPLYYFCDSANDLLVFASELRPLLRSGLVPRRLCSRGLIGYLQSGSVPEPYTLLEGVRCLEAGSSLFWREGTLSKHQYWQLSFETGETRTDSETVALTRAALLDSVSHHFVSDVPVGIFLSGGIDSTAVVALSRAVGKADLQTFSISFDDPAFNEGEVAARTAAHFKTTHTDHRLQSKEAEELFENFLGKVDQPTIDGFNTFIVSKLAHDHGLKVVLSGLGGDELFGGYPSFKRVPQLAQASRVLGLLGGRGLAAKALRSNRRPQLRRVASYLGRPPTIAGAYQAYRGVFSADEAAALAARWGCTTEQDLEEGDREMASSRPELPTVADEISFLETSRYMRNQLLRDSDVMSMAWSLELRVPFVDRQLFESVSRVPAGFRLRQNKQLLLDAVPEVPEWVWNRPKRGFLFPFQQWLEGGWGEMLLESARDSPVPVETWYQKWSLFVLSHWCQSNGVTFPD